MPTFRVLAVALTLAATAVAACAPTSPSATGEPVAGCRRHLGGGADVSYSGEPSEYDNLTYWSSRDGSCRGALTGSDTLMVAPTRADAAFLCDALLRAEVDGRIDESRGPWSIPFGAMGHVCTPR